MPHRPHKFDRPPPGQASRFDAICVVCGGRRSVIGPDSECRGKEAVAVAETRHDYDPYDAQD